MHFTCSAHFIPSRHRQLAITSQQRWFSYLQNPSFFFFDMCCHLFPLKSKYNEMGDERHVNHHELI